MQDQRSSLWVDGLRLQLPPKDTRMRKGGVEKHTHLQQSKVCWQGQS